MLERFVIEVARRGVKSVDIALYTLPGGTALQQIEEAIANHLIDDVRELLREERDEGFQLEDVPNGELRGVFYYASDKLIYDVLRETVSKIRRVESVSFEIDTENERLKVFSNRPSHCQKFKKVFQDVTGSHLVVRGLYQHAADSMDRVNAFLGGLNVADALLIALWFPQALRERVFRITYDGQDILNDPTIQGHITNGNAIVTGFTILLHYDGYIFKVKVGSSERMGYVSVKLRAGLLETGRRLAQLLYDRYIAHLE